MSTANAATAHSDEHPEGVSVTTYAVIFVALLVLLFISVAVAFYPNQSDTVRTLLTLIGFSIAGAKAILIILYFMHVKFSSRLTWIFALGSFFFLFIMVALTLNDYSTREPVAGTEHGLRIVEHSGIAENEGPTAEPQEHTLTQPSAETPTP
jgi:cytochrome c oxidase subunit 4